MNRRSFIKRVGGAFAAIAVGANLISDRATARPPIIRNRYGVWRGKDICIADVICPEIFLEYAIERTAIPSPFSGLINAP